MGQVYGFILLSIYAALCIVFCALVFIKRNNVFLSCRNPYMLISQNVGGVLCTTFIGLFIGLRPHYNCSVYFLGFMSHFSLFITPMLIRGWQLCVNYNISLLKIQYRAHFFREWAGTSWFFRHKWVGSSSFLWKVYLGQMLVTVLIPVFTMSFPGQSIYLPETHSCKWKYHYIGVAFAIIFLIIGVVIAVMLRKVKDVYYVKYELNMLFPLWLLAFVAYDVYINPPKQAEKVFASGTIIMIADILTILICNVLPLVKAYQFERNCRRESADSLEHFRELLENVDFRDVFHDYLIKQFRHENLQFYEVVSLWKALPPNDHVAHHEKLKSIIHVFLADEAVCRIKIKASTYDKLMTDCQYEEPELNIFDEALEEIIQDMHVNSFLQFKNQNGGMLADERIRQFIFVATA